MTSQFGLNQIINEPTHITKNSSTCIDLLFTSQTNLVIKSGVHSSLNPNCHHQIIFAKFDLRIFYPPPYERNVWHYKQTNYKRLSGMCLVREMPIGEVSMEVHGGSVRHGSVRWGSVWSGKCPWGNCPDTIIFLYFCFQLFLDERLLCSVVWSKYRLLVSLRDLPMI